MSESPRLEEVFCAALQKQSAAARAAFLDQACQVEPDLRRAVERLLAAHDIAGSFLESPPSGLPTTDAPALEEGNSRQSGDGSSDLAGTSIGPYKLLEAIGEGGMGVVYMADQENPIRRRVALKIIKPGLDTRQVVARFEAERQALAMMDHPNIARVLDAGSTDQGRPYFVMELVRGVPITQYCDLNQLSVAERLELFGKVCQAVQHAHQKGIIHRDLKPSNVLVTLHDGAPVPKVIDFGVAKAINQQLTERTLFTNFAQMVGTPLYMSPEQAEMSGLDVDTRTDIYSLGVLLYEMLTGTTPFDRETFRKASYDEIRRIIREQEPVRPSTRISSLGQTRTSVANHRQADPRKLSQMVRGELDWVVMKTLEKDRSRRYETAGALAADVARYLTHQPVEAGPPSSVYRFRKFARRNRAALATSAVLIGALLLGSVVSTWQAIRATQAERRADEQAAEAQANAETAVREKERADAKAQEAAENAATSVREKERADQKAAEAQASAEQANVASAKAIEEAEHAKLEAEKARQSAAFLAHMFEDAAPLQIAGIRFGIDKTPSNITIARREILDRGAERIKDELERQPLVQASLRDTIANAYYALGSFDRATTLWEEAFEARQKLLPREHLDLAASLQSMGNLRYSQYQYTAAAAFHEEALTIRTRLLGDDHPLTDDSRLAVAIVLGTSQPGAANKSRAIQLCRDSVAWHRKHFGAKHPQTALTMLGLAATLQNKGEESRDEVTALLLQATPILTKDPATKPIGETLSKFHQAMLTLRLGTKNAVPALDAAVASLREAAPADHPFTLLVLRASATMYAASEQFDKAETLIREVAASELRMKLDTSRTGQDMAELARFMDRSKAEGAEPIYRDSIALMKESLKSKIDLRELSWRLFELTQTISSFGSFLRIRGRREEAKLLYESSITEAEQHSHSFLQVRILGQSGALACEEKDFIRAQREFERALSAIDSAPDMLPRSRQFERATLLYVAATACEKVDEYDRANAYYRKSIQVAREPVTSDEAKNGEQQKDSKIGQADNRTSHGRFLPGFARDRILELAKLLRKQDKNSELVELYQESLTWFQEQQDYANSVQIQLGLAKLQRESGQLSEAEASYRDGLKTIEALDSKELESNRDVKAEFLLHLGDLHAEQGHKFEALSAFHDAILGGSLGQRTVDVARRACGVLGEAGEADEMVEFLQSLLPPERKAGCYAAWSVAWREFCLSLIEKGPRRADSLDELFKLSGNVLDEARQTQGEKCTDVATLLATIGMARLKNKQLDEAEPLLKSALEMRRELLRKDDPALGSSERLWGTWLCEKGRYDEAEPLLLSAHRKMTKQYGPNGDWTLATSEQLLRLYDATDQPEKAETYRQMLKGRAQAP